MGFRDKKSNEGKRRSESGRARSGKDGGGKNGLLRRKKRKESKSEREKRENEVETDVKGSIKREKKKTLPELRKAFSLILP